MKLVRKHFGQFMMRGLVAMGFGPLVLAIVYSILAITGVVEQVSVSDMILGIFTMTLLAFLTGGITVVYQIEELAISKAITIHGVILYICYAVVYLVNGWIEDGVIPFAIFTAIFVVGYLLIWIIIYLITRKSTEKVNNSLKF